MPDWQRKKKEKKKTARIDLHRCDKVRFTHERERRAARGRGEGGEGLSVASATAKFKGQIDLTNL